MTEKPTVDFEQVLRDSGMPTTEAEIDTAFKAIVKDENYVTNTSRMSPFWRLIQKIVATPVLWLKDVLVQVVLTNMFVATATGAMLRLLAWAVNIEAKPASAAAGALRFYKSSAANAVTVNAGTLIQTERINGVFIPCRSPKTPHCPQVRRADSYRSPRPAPAAGTTWRRAITAFCP